MILPLLYSALVVFGMLSFACLVVLTRLKWYSDVWTLVHLALDDRLLPAYGAAFAITYFWTSRPTK